MDGWVTFEDVRSLSHWLDPFQKESPKAQAVFVFTFRFENIDIESHGGDVYDYSGERFLFLAIPQHKYTDAMKIRRSKWQTVTLPAEDFRRQATSIEGLLK